MTDATGGPDPEWDKEIEDRPEDFWREARQPPAPPGSSIALCGACVRSGVGVCDTYPNCPAGQGRGEE